MVVYACPCLKLLQKEQSHAYVEIQELTFNKVLGPKHLWSQLREKHQMLFATLIDILENGIEDLFSSSKVISCRLHV